MDLSRLFRACKVGDLETVKILVEKKDVEINCRDKFDSTPLYYACLCGHLKLVRFLLENGARCNINTFDGERCVYGALTPEIRKILAHEYKVISKKVIRRNDYDEFLRKAFEFGELYDVTFYVHNYTFKAHRYILMARCPYFYNQFCNKWNRRQTITINHSMVNPKAFRVLLHYLYTGIFEFHVSLSEDVLRLVRQCKLDSAYHLITNHIDTCYVKFKSKIKNLTVYLESSINQDYYKIFYHTLPIELQDSLSCVESKQSEVQTTSFCQLSEYGDIVFKVENHLFKCHRLFLCGRSEYFRALIQDYFDVFKDDYNGLPVYQLSHITIDSFQALLSYIYTNQAELSIELAFELLLQSDVYLIRSLTKHCANIIENHISLFNAIDIIKMARMFHLPKLESTATEQVATNLNQYLDKEDFRQLILSDAKEVKERQETDTIEIIDDIRYFLANSRGLNIEHELNQVDILLHSLDLRA